MKDKRQPDTKKPVPGTRLKPLPPIPPGPPIRILREGDEKPRQPR